MQTKLTLRLDKDLIEPAKTYAQHHGKSLSQMVADYFVLLLKEDNQRGDDALPLPPITASLVGQLRDAGVDAGDYYRYLEEKHR